MKVLAAILLFLTSAALLPAASSRSATSKMKHRPATRGDALVPQASAGKKNKANVRRVVVRRVVVRRMVRGHWVKVSRMVRVNSAPAVQPHPDAERYQQIQKALADKGFFKGEVNGQWNADSVDALKRFQTNQNLTADGKLTALAIIGLGLGPKHDVNSAPPNTPQ